MTDTEVVNRLEKLERDNQRLKRGVLAFLAVLVALSAIYATRPVPQKITAHEFDIVNAEGLRVGEIGAWRGEPHIWLDGELGGGNISLDPDHIALYGSGHVSLLVAGGITLGGNNAKVALMDRGKTRVGLTMKGHNGSIFVSDNHGYSMELGSTAMLNPTTGTTYETSADSIVMFGNDKKHHVIWQAP
jgi:hypothetical protein